MVPWRRISTTRRVPQPSTEQLQGFLQQLHRTKTDCNTGTATNAPGAHEIQPGHYSAVSFTEYPIKQLHAVVVTSVQSLRQYTSSNIPHRGTGCSAPLIAVCSCFYQAPLRARRRSAGSTTKRRVPSGQNKVVVYTHCHSLGHAVTKISQNMYPVH